ncbi:MAG: hypothetical protein HRK26_00325 [Rickettsiaceae bacterium H1]|nr:hypothetical protein [Rickettsiaceae bacterium H1]
MPGIEQNIKDLGQGFVNVGKGAGSLAIQNPVAFTILAVSIVAALIASGIGLGILTTKCCCAKVESKNSAQVV